MSFEEITKIVLDNGSHNIRAGFAGDDVPKTCFPTLLSNNPKFIFDFRNPSSSSEGDYLSKKEFLIGCELFNDDDGGECMENLKIKCPFDGRSIGNFDLMEKIWHYTFYGELKVEPEECPLVLIEHALTEKREREKKIQIMFETFSVPLFYAGYDSVMSMYASGRTDGIVVNMGYEETQIVPVCEGYALPHAISTMKFGGRHLTEYLSEKLKLDGYNLNDRQVSQLKEKLCYVALDYEEEMRNQTEPSTFELPDGKTVQIKKERIQCPEIYFTPNILQQHSGIDPIHTQTYSSICKCDIDGRRYWYSNILLTGASSCFTKMGQRMTKEMVFLSPSSMKVKVIEAPERNIFAWIGGSIFGSISSTQTLFITREEYEEIGPVLVHRRCF